MNARLGNLPIPAVVELFGEYNINENGQNLRELSDFNELKILNTFFVNIHGRQDV
jgi:hypothetical protein